MSEGLLVSRTAQETELGSKVLLGWVASLSMVLAAASLALTSYFAFRGYSNVLFWDQWTVYTRLADQPTPWAALAEGWIHHAGHRMVLPYFVYWLDGKIFGWSNAPLILVSCVLQVGLASLMLALLRRAPKQMALTASGVIVALLVYGAQIENFVWGMQVSYFLTFTLAALALVCNAQRRVGVAILLAVGSTFSMMNGLLIWPILVLQIVFLRLGLMRLAVVVLCGVVATGAYFTGGWNYASGAAHPGIRRFILDFTKFLGGPANSVSGLLAVAAGVFVLATLVACAFIVVFKRNALALTTTALRSSTVFLGLAMFAIGTAAMTLIGRPIQPVGLRDAITIASRSNTNVLILWACLCGAVVSVFSEKLPQVVYAVIAAPVALMLVAAPHVIRDMSWWSDLFGHRLNVLAAEVCHGEMAPDTAVLNPDPAALVRVTAQMKQRGQGFTTAAWCRKP